MKTNSYKIFEKRHCLSRDELINYASGKMTEKEKNFVERHLQDCELCNEALEGIAEMNDVHDLKIHYDEIVKSFTTVKKIPERSNAKIYLAIAAVLSVFALAGIYMNYFNKKTVDNNLAVSTTEDPASNNKVATSLEKGKAAAESTVVIENRVNAGNEFLSQAQLREIVISDSTTTGSYSFTSDETPPAPVEESIKASSTKEDIVSAPPSLSEYKDAYQSAGASKRITQVEEFGKLKNMNHAGAVVIGNYKISPEYVKMEEPVTLSSKPAAVKSEMQKGKHQETSAADQDKKTNETTYQQQLNTVFNHVDATNYTLANKEISDFNSRHPEDINGIFYRGLVNFHLQNNQQSLADFEHVIAKKDKVFNEDALWYKALTLTRMGKFNDARKIFNQLIANKSTYDNRSREVLEMIGDD